MTSRPPADAIDRREALRRAALLLGGAISAPAVAGVLAGCGGGGGGGGDARPGGETAAWTPRALTAAQGELVATVAEHIIPTTDTPGARAAGVHRFVDTMLAEYYPAADRQRFVAGLAALDARARRECGGREFLRCGAAEQRALLERIDAEAFAAPPPPASDETRFFRTMKELTLLGYYTSEVGATRELRYAAVPGRFDGCVPLAQIGRAWAT